MGSEQIDVWRIDELEGIEFRSGVAVKEPYPKHWHEEYQLCFLGEGGGELTYRGTSHNTPKMSLFIVHPGEVHSNSTETGCSFRSIYVLPGVVQNVLNDSDRKITELPFFPDPMIFDWDIIQEYLRLHQPRTSFFTALERETALLELLQKLVSRYSRDNAAAQTFGKESDAVKKVKEYIVEHYEQNISLKTLSRVANLSQFHLNRVFSDEIGMPPHAFQIQVRIAKAKQFIKQGFPLSKVAATTGFADQSHFSRHFKRLMKITPGEY